MKIDEISKVAKLMKQFDLTEFSLESEEIKLRMKRASDNIPYAVTLPAPAAMHPAMATAPAAGASAEKSAAAVEKSITIDSPIVGTFYSAPAPDAPTFVKAGDTVNEDTVVCIVEAMKVMNEIKAETSGVVKRILVNNATPVEYGQPLIELEMK